MSLTRIPLKSNIKNYFVDFDDSDGFLGNLISIPNVIFVIDSNVWKFHRAGLLSVLPKDSVLVYEVSEACKSLDGLRPIYDEMIKQAAKKNAALVSIGGGILQDLTGFVASTLYRGIKWVFVPTTMLAQCDSCIGAKTSLNYQGFKNLLGTFYPPNEIYVNTRFLTTQEDDVFFSGVGELVKLHLIGGEEAVNKLLTEIPYIFKREESVLSNAIHRSLFIKKGYIEADEFDQGRRNILNFGHCFGHALESVTNFKISHGQAVILGMILANSVAVSRNLLSIENSLYIRRKILFPFLKINLDKIRFDSNNVVRAMENDKKRLGNDLALIMMKDNYEMIRVNDLKAMEVKAVLEGLNEIN
ncbi:3-dehydroquinate synthase [Candidatus Saganbacteria bacterium]|nr:3-dehydroquinate synthase [Candidatus Saganbacteria bacterium]